MTNVSVGNVNNLKQFQASLPKHTSKPNCPSYSMATEVDYGWPPSAVFNCSGTNGTYPITLFARFESADCSYDLGPFLR